MYVSLLQKYLSDHHPGTHSTKYTRKNNQKRFHGLLVYIPKQGVLKRYHNKRSTEAHNLSHPYPNRVLRVFMVRPYLLAQILSGVQHFLVELG
jgi:hypothetical protein